MHPHPIPFRPWLRPSFTKTKFDAILPALPAVQQIHNENHVYVNSSHQMTSHHPSSIKSNVIPHFPPHTISSRWSSNASRSALNRFLPRTLCAKYPRPLPLLSACIFEHDPLHRPTSTRTRYLCLRADPLGYHTDPICARTQRNRCQDDPSDPTAETGEKAWTWLCGGRGRSEWLFVLGWGVRVCTWIERWVLLLEVLWVWEGGSLWWKSDLPREDLFLSVDFWLWPSRSGWLRGLCFELRWGGCRGRWFGDGGRWNASYCRVRNRGVGWCPWWSWWVWCYWCSRTPGWNRDWKVI